MKSFLFLFHSNFQDISKNHVNNFLYILNFFFCGSFLHVIGVILKCYVNNSSIFFLEDKLRKWIVIVKKKMTYSIKLFRMINFIWSFTTVTKCFSFFLHLIDSFLCHIWHQKYFQLWVWVWRWHLSWISFFLSSYFRYFSFLLYHHE